MVSGELVHWYIGKGCNARPPCIYCFEQDYGFLLPDSLSQTPEFQSPKNLRQIAQRLAAIKTKNSRYVQKTILGGGEPLTAQNIDEVIGILGEAGTDIEIHTNGILLYKNQRRIDQLKEQVDGIALPIDSLDPEIQAGLRQPSHLDIFNYVFPRLIKNKKTRVKLHTVITTANIDSILPLYDSLKDEPFDFWKFYEINAGLATMNLWKWPPRTEKEAYSLSSRTLRLRELAGLPHGAVRGATTRSGPFVKKVLELEARLKERGDPRTKVVLIDDTSTDPYIFVNNASQALTFCVRNIEGDYDRDFLGDILKKDFEKILEELEREHLESNTKMTGQRARDLIKI